jgi:hypothetical protein
VIGCLRGATVLLIGGTDPPAPDRSRDYSSARTATGDPADTCRVGDDGDRDDPPLDDCETHDGEGLAVDRGHGAGRPVDHRRVQARWGSGTNGGDHGGGGCSLNDRRQMEVQHSDACGHRGTTANFTAKCIQAPGSCVSLSHFEQIRLTGRKYRAAMRFPYTGGWRRTENTLRRDEARLGSESVILVCEEEWMLKWM